MRINVVIIAGSALLILVVWSAAVCPGLYSHLPLSAQVAMYGWRLRILPFPSESARSSIAHHGLEAAETLATDLNREQPTLLPSESAYILAMIQQRGTSLRNSTADRSLRRFLSSKRATKADVIAGQFALDQIENDVKLPPSLQPR
jgi:hypothetical protein